MLICFKCGRSLIGECTHCAFAEEEQRAQYRVQFAYQMLEAAEEELENAREELEKLWSSNGS